MSEFGLRKACRRLRVPMPAQHAWYGRPKPDALSAPPLPPPRPSLADTIEVRIPEGEPIIDLIAEPVIGVPSRLLDPHPLVVITADELTGIRPDEFGRLCPDKPRGLDIRVSPVQLDRALRVANTLVRGIESIGHTVEVGIGWDHRHQSWAVIDGEKVQFKLYEPSNQRVNPQYPKGLVRHFTYTPSGRLELIIEERIAPGTIKTVRDRSATRLIEKGIGKIIVGLHACAQIMKIERAEKEEEEREAEARRIDRERQERRVAYQKWLREELLNQARDHHDAQMIRAFVGSLQVRKVESAASGFDSRWIEWARAEADRLDPVTNGRDSFLPLEMPESWKPAKEPTDKLATSGLFGVSHDTERTRSIMRAMGRRWTGYRA